MLYQHADVSKVIIRAVFNMRFKDTLGLSHKLKIVEHELCQKIELELAKLSLTLPQYTVLSHLEEKITATNAELAKKSSVTPQTMNRIMQNLERDGFVVKLKNSEHGLKQDFKMKPKAEKILCDAHALVNDIEIKMVKGFTKKSIKEFEGILEKCLQNLHTF
jgi:DNA-binding MarR family transcriptional regulator